MIGRDVRVSGELTNTDIAMNGVFRPGLVAPRLDGVVDEREEFFGLDFFLIDFPFNRSP